MKMVNLVLDGGLSIKNIREVDLFGRFISRNQTQGYLKDMSILSSHKQDNADKGGDLEWLSIERNQ